jgi:hypothetical protein
MTFVAFKIFLVLILSLRSTYFTLCGPGDIRIWKLHASEDDFLQ